MIRCDLYIYVLFYFILKFRHLLVLRGTVYFQFQLAFPSFRVVFFFIREFRSFGLIYLTNLLAKLSTHTQTHSESAERNACVSDTLVSCIYYWLLFYFFGCFLRRNCQHDYVRQL